MRVLAVAMPLVGHTLPLLPLARALRAAGHEVVLVTGGDAARIATGGIPVHDATAGFRPGPASVRTVVRHPRTMVRIAAGRAGARGAALLLAPVNRAMAGELERLAGDFRPDLVVHEPAAAVGATTAAHRGIPAVLLANVLYDAHDQLREQARAVPDLLPRPGQLPAPALTLDLAPPSVVGPRPGRPLRPVPWSEGADLPGWLTQPARRPRLLVSRSTVAGPGGGDPTAAVLGCAPDVDAEIVLVRPPQRLRGRALPANVRCVDWLPLDEAMAHCSAVVHHGGAGTVLGALAAGIPQLVVPGLGDRTTNAGLVAARGAGLAVPARRITASVLRRLLGDPALAAAAHEVAAEIAAMPAPAAVVPALERLAR